MNTEIMGNVISFKRFEIHDGDGIRTTLFLKGCPLNCKWCHNPESISKKPILAFYENACTKCGRCLRVCTQKAHDISGFLHTLDRDKCILCGKCEAACPSDALKVYGKTMSCDEAYQYLMRDKMFYDKSGGGVTLSGGEPLLQPEFCRELLARLKKSGVSTAVDTCGFVSKAAIDKVIDFTDTFLFDVKAFDEEIHIAATGRSNKIILENLKYIDSLKKNIEIRIPLIIGINDGEIEKIAELLSELETVSCVKVLPYHDYAEDKYSALDMKDSFCSMPVPTDEQLENARNILKLRLPDVKVE